MYPYGYPLLTNCQQEVVYTTSALAPGKVYNFSTLAKTNKLPSANTIQPS